MSDKLKVACIQNSATPDVNENIGITVTLARQAAEAGADLICTAEYFSGLETKDGLFYPAAFKEEDHPVIPAFAEAARELNVCFLLGSIGIITADGRINNRSYVMGQDGQIIATYDKIHMFDVNLEAGSYMESATIAPGNQAVVANLPWGGLGLSICYDLRFAALYRKLAHMGAAMLATPAAFTKTTGEAHWHVLNRARAIETGSYVIAPCQYGTITGGGSCFGHSLIIDPWGKILCDGGDKEGFVIADVDLGAVDNARSRIPALNHDRDFS